MSQFGSILERRDAGGWCLLVGGMMIMGVTMLMPTWLQVQSLREHRDSVIAELDALQTKHANYLQFEQAVSEGDPILLQRLAWHQLHLKPVGMSSFDDATPAEPGQAMHYEHWLDVNQPAPTKATAGTPTQLERLTTQPMSRLGMLALGGLLIASGVLSALRHPARW